ncbi:MAG TPA: HDOD domain-containing protein [Steroidobacteraceae bacterium]|nr:HDOD domain-containing protein [Steroidobacteraceae bacterium]
MSLNPAAALSSLDSQVARDYLCDALQLPQSIAPMPHLCAKLAELTAHEETDSVQLVRLVQSDPMVAGEIMRVANSAALRPRNAIASLQQAVSWLGVATVRNITVATVLHGEVFSAPGHEPEAEELWREAWLGGLWAKEIARLRRKHVETAFLAGLMHRAGAALALKLFARFERERRTALDMQTFRSLVVEFEVPCGRLLMSNWCVPSEIQEAASEWRSYRSSREVDLAGTVNAAHLLTQHTLHPQLLDEESVLTDTVFEQLGVFPDERVVVLEQRDRVRQVSGV